MVSYFVNSEGEGGKRIKGLAFFLKKNLDLTKYSVKVSEIYTIAKKKKSKVEEDVVVSILEHFLIHKEGR